MAPDGRAAESISNRHGVPESYYRALLDEKIWKSRNSKAVIPLRLANKNLNAPYKRLEINAKKKAKPVTPEAVIARRRKDLLDRRDIKSFLTRLAGLILFIYVLFGVVFRLTIVSGDDMKPTLRSGDIALVYCFPSNLWNNDIVSYEANGKVRPEELSHGPAIR